MIIFEKVRWKNFLSTGNQFTEIDLNRNETTLIIGENGAGKSTVLDALCFALFGKPFRTISKSTNELFDEVFYRIYIKEGVSNVNVFDWTYMDVTNENSFVLDTSILIPREYYIEVKGVKHNEEIFYPEVIKFEIVSEK